MDNNPSKEDMTPVKKSIILETKGAKIEESTDNPMVKPTELLFIKRKNKIDQIANVLARKKRQLNTPWEMITPTQCS